MKKFLFSLGILLSIGLSAFYTIHNTTATVSDEFADEIFPWMMDNTLTKFTDVDDFRPGDSITRAEASKFVVNYAGLIGLETGDDTCTFRDTIGFDTSLVPYIQDSCKYGLFRGNNGNFLPRNSITEAEALAVIIRSLDGVQDESMKPWYREYYDRAKELGILDGEDINSLGKKKITREKLGTWVYRGYIAYSEDSSDTTNADDSTLYETDVAGPSDCTSYETYDPKGKVCSYECIDEAQCKSIQSQIDAELGTWASDLDGESRDVPESVAQPVQGVVALYSVSKGENIQLVSGKDTPEYQSLWKEVADLSPDSLSDTYIENFELYSDPSSDVIAYVSDDDGNGKWKVDINLPIHTNSNLKEQKATLIHELSHIITLNEDQFMYASEVCPNYETDEGCTKATSYMNAFAQKYWGTEKTATYSESKFVSEYASSSPEEDAAESFAFYVLGANHTDTTIREQKMNFWNGYPEIVKIRNDMRSVLASDIIRAKKGN